MLASKLPSMSDGSFEKFLVVSHQSFQDVYEKMQFASIMLSYRKILKGLEADIFCAFYVDSKRSDEIAQEYNITIAQVKGLLKRAYNQIRQHIFLNYHQRRSRKKH
jgi:DNA-directed RNA polymerase specialized sigma subunit